MQIAELLIRARALMVENNWPAASAYRALEEAASGDFAALGAALEALDAVAPHPWTFITFADGGEFVSEGDFVGITYRYDRQPVEVLALLGKAAQRAWRSEMEVHP